MRQTQSRFAQWIEARLSVIEIWKRHAAEYYVPKNLNFWYVFGIFSSIVLINQIITGIWLTMYYTPTEAQAFSSVEFIMRDVRFGWLLRYMHTTGASLFFVVVYLHMYRSIMYGSFKAPRELVWIIGMFIYCFLLMESASGYVLPWGQMSYWAIKVLVTVFSVIPFIGKQLIIFIQGDYNVSEVTLHRFFAFHVIAIPLILIFLAFLHVFALHKVGSNNPDGIDIKQHSDEQGKPLDGIPFHPYYTVKDFYAVTLFLIVFALILFFAPTFFGYFIEPPNLSPANPLITPLHIAPPWYMAPFYSILRAIPNKFLGVTLAGLAIVILFFLPWLDRGRSRSIRYRGPWSKGMLCVLIASFAGLGVLGTLSLSDINIYLSRLFTVGYFSFFVFMPLYTRYEKAIEPPTRVTPQ